MIIKVILEFSRGKGEEELSTESATPDITVIFNG
jgi:hypothetical protein